MPHTDLQFWCAELMLFSIGSPCGRKEEYTIPPPKNCLGLASVGRLPPMIFLK